MLAAHSRPVRNYLPSGRLPTRMPSSRLPAEQAHRPTGHPIDGESADTSAHEIPDLPARPWPVITTRTMSKTRRCRPVLGRVRLSQLC